MIHDQKHLRRLLRPSWRRRTWLFISAMIVAVAGAIGLLANINALFSILLPGDPVFTPGQSSFASPLAVPFKVENKSAVFDFKNLSIKCLVAATIRGEPPSGGTLTFGSPGEPMPFRVVGLPSRLGAGDEGAYTCAIVAIGNDVGPRPRVLFAEMTFESERDSDWFWQEGRRVSRSPTFYLDIATVPPQWKRTPLN